MSDRRQYDGFAVFYEDKRVNPKAPEWKGKGTISKEVATYLFQCLKEGTNPELELVGWTKKSERTGTKFLSMNINIPFKVKKEMEERGGEAPPRDPPPRRQMPSDPFAGPKADPFGDDEIPF